MGRLLLSFFFYAASLCAGFFVLVWISCLNSDLIRRHGTVGTATAIILTVLVIPLFRLGQICARKRNKP